jgi:hypothetical protein
MGNRAAVETFYKNFAKEKPAFSAGENVDLMAILSGVMKYLQVAGEGPYTMLIQPDDKLDALGIDHDGPLEQREIDALIGWMLDVVVFGDALPRDDVPDGLVLSTVAGSSLTAARDGDRIVLTDPWGASARVLDSVFAGPLVTGVAVDDVLMWGGWKDGFGEA